jgi:hypothetical protein
VTFPEKYKRYDFPQAKVTLTAAGKPGVFTLSADKPAFFVKPEASKFAGAFDDASFALLPGETRTPEGEHVFAPGKAIPKAPQLASRGTHQGVQTAAAGKLQCLSVGDGFGDGELRQRHAVTRPVRYIAVPANLPAKCGYSHRFL